MISNQYPSNWKILKLEVALDRISNGLVRSQNKNAEGIPATRIETIKDEIVDPTRVGYLDNVTDEELQKFKLKTGDILFSHINSEEHIGKSAIYKGNPDIILHGMNLLLLRTNETVCDSLYLNNLLKFYRLKGIFVGLAARAVGQASINQGKMKSLEIPLPPLPEQRAIARALRAVQAAREARLRELALERERKAALMEHLFTHGTRGEATKQTKIGEMPESWITESLGNIAKITSGGTPDRDEPKYWNGNVPWVKTGEIDYNIILEPEEKITQEGLENSAAKIIPAGTLLMAMYGQGITRGKVAILGIDAAINQACAAIVTNSNINTNYLFYFLAHTYERIRNLGHGANQKNLNAALIKSILIPMPKLSEQQEIADILQACDTKITALDHEAQLLDELFKAMLEELMSGRLSTAGLVELNSEITK